MKVLLYTTLGCHLCEQAHAMLNHLGIHLQQSGVQPLEIEPIEIADDDALMEEYGIRIPVVRVAGREAPGDELGWPFDLESLQYFLND